jgi:pre-rRNA-processing protein TSR4
MQLVPHAIAILEEEEQGITLEGGGMEWGTVILGVCGRDCPEKGREAGEVGYVEEWAGVQWEEQMAKK